MSKKCFEIPYTPALALIVLGKGISLARQSRGWQQIALAKRLGVSRQTVAKMERGEPSVKAGIYFTAAWLLNVPLVHGVDFADANTDNFINRLVKLLDDQPNKRIYHSRGKSVDDNF